MTACAVRRPRLYLLARRWWRLNSWAIRDRLDAFAFLACLWGLALALLFLGD